MESLYMEIVNLFHVMTVFIRTKLVRCATSVYIRFSAFLTPHTNSARSSLNLAAKGLTPATASKANTYPSRGRRRRGARDRRQTSRRYQQNIKVDAEIQSKAESRLGLHESSEMTSLTPAFSARPGGIQVISSSSSTYWASQKT